MPSVDVKRTAINTGYGKIMSVHPEYTFNPPYGFPARNGSGGGTFMKLKKGSPAAMHYMAYLRSLRKRRRRK